MMKRKKRRKNCIGFILFMLCFLCMSIPVSAASAYQDFQYEESEDGITIYAYTGDAAEVAIPASIGDKPVTAIGEYAFLLCNTVEIIKVPSSVKTIAESAFSGAANLKQVIAASEDTTIPNPEDASSTNQIEEAEKSSGTSTYVVTVDESVDTEINEKFGESTNKAVDSTEESNQSEKSSVTSDEIGGQSDGVTDPESEEASMENTEHHTSKTFPIIPVIVGIGILLLGVIGGILYKMKR